MTIPNFMPLTLKGVGGKRYLKMPGVIYPDQVLKVMPGHNPEDGKPYKAVPAWGIGSQEAANMLGCTVSAARAMMHQAKVPFRVVLDGKSPKRVYWHRDAVARFADERKPAVESVSPSLIDTVQAMKILGRGRSTLNRFSAMGRLHPVQVRRVSDSGTRLRNYYLRSEVVKLRHYLRAMEEKAAELNLIGRRQAVLSPSEKTELQHALSQP